MKDQVRRCATTEMPACSCSRANPQYGMQARGSQTALKASNHRLRQETAALFTSLQEPVDLLQPKSSKAFAGDQQQ